MAKRKATGLPYLRSSLKYDWAGCCENVADDDLKELISMIGDRLIEAGLQSPEPSVKYSDQTASGSDAKPDTEKQSSKTKRAPRLPYTHTINDLGAVGLNGVFEMAGSDGVIIFDINVLKSSAVGHTIGLYADCHKDTTPMYAVAGLDEALSPRLNRRGTEAVGFTPRCAGVCERVKALLKPVRVIGSKSGTNASILSPPTTFLSMGKDSSKKKKKKK